MHNSNNLKFRLEKSFIENIKTALSLFWQKDISETRHQYSFFSRKHATVVWTKHPRNENKSSSRKIHGTANNSTGQPNMSNDQSQMLNHRPTLCIRPIGHCQSKYILIETNQWQILLIKAVRVIFAILFFVRPKHQQFNFDGSRSSCVGEYHTDGIYRWNALK